MKKYITAFILCAGLGTCAVQSHADEWRGHGMRHHGGNHWIAPALIGGVIGYELSRPRYYEPPVVVVQQPTTVYTQPTCVYPQLPMYNQILTVDQYGRSVYINQFAGCK